MDSIRLFVPLISFFLFFTFEPIAMVGYLRDLCISSSPLVAQAGAYCGGRHLLARATERSISSVIDGPRSSHKHNRSYAYGKEGLILFSTLYCS